jgi:hypothetical protein
MSRFKLASLVIVSVSLAATLALTTCGGGGFSQEWRTALKAPATDALAGAWEGSWLSHHNAHTGRLRAIIGPTDATGKRTVRYHATWAKVLSGGFTAEHTFLPTKDKGYHFSGKQSLGKWGAFNYDGTVKGDSFEATYKAGGDHGVFTMKKVATP